MLRKLTLFARSATNAETPFYVLHYVFFMFVMQHSFHLLLGSVIGFVILHCFYTYSSFHGFSNPYWAVMLHFTPVSHHTKECSTALVLFTHLHFEIFKRWLASVGKKEEPS